MHSPIGRDADGLRARLPGQGDIDIHNCKWGISIEKNGSVVPHDLLGRGGDDRGGDLLRGGAARDRVAAALCAAS